MAKCFPFFESSLADERQWTQVVRMDFIDHSPFKQIVATLLLLLGMSSALRGLRFLIFAIRKPEHPSGPLRVVRGLRGLIVALALFAWAIALLYSKKWLFIIGAIVLAQELYEMGFLSLILRADGKI